MRVDRLVEMRVVADDCEDVLTAGYMNWAADEIDRIRPVITAVRRLAELAEAPNSREPNRQAWMSKATRDLLAALATYDGDTA